MGAWNAVKNFIGGEPGKAVTQFASPEQEAQYKEYMSSMGGKLDAAQTAQGAAQTNAVGALGKGFTPANIGELSATGLPQAQTQFNVAGATQYGPDGRPLAPQYQNVAYGRPGELGSALSGVQNFQAGGQPVTQAQQQLNATMGNLGQYVAGAGAGTSQATIQQSAAMDEQQKTAMANALGQIKEQGFAGGATAGGMGNLGAMAAAQSAGDFARQKAGLLESERQAGLQAMGQQGQLAGTLGNLGLGASGQNLQALTSMGGLAQGEAGMQLQAGMANQDAALKAAALAQSGDIAGAELALKGTGMNMDQAMQLNQQNTQRLIANQGAQGQADSTNAALMQARANLLAQSPEMQALQSQLAFGQQLGPYQGAVAGRGGLLQPIASAAGDIMQGIGAVK